VSGGSDTAVAQAETSSVTYRSAWAGRRSEPNRNWEPSPPPLHQPEDWQKTLRVLSDADLYPADPKLQEQPEPTLTPAPVQEAEPVEQPQEAGDDQTPLAPSNTQNTLNGSKQHWLSKIKALTDGLFSYMGRLYSLEELAERPPIKAAGITRDDLDSLIPF
jgi:hypothetical protein